ncbi:MAG TPA: hypothetical protein VKQ72_12640, partial [Aggregatilineales bacterium]|nr:hypothetical protein [Aggregatilineales bacterium]
MTARDKITVSEFDDFLRHEEVGDHHFELVVGEIVEKMPTQLHAAIISLVNFFLMLYLQEHPIGYSLTEARYRASGDQDNDL